MKNTLLYIALLLLFSCDLNIPVEDEITGDDAINDVPIANETLAGIYASFPKDKTFLDILSDDYYPNYDIRNNESLKKLYGWEILEIKLKADNLWSPYYQTINRINVLQKSYPNIEVGDGEEQEFDHIKAEALAIKAHCYFDLIRLYAPVYNDANKDRMGVILKDNIRSESLPRSSLAESYRVLEKLSLDAIASFPKDTNDAFRWNKKAVKALLADVYLYWGKYQKAIDLCNPLLVGMSLDKATYEVFWKDFKMEKEVLFAFDKDKLIFNLKDIYDGINGNYMFYPNRKITYEAADYRGEITLVKQGYRDAKGVVKQVDYLYKYRKSIDDGKPKPIPIIRTALLYFIKAEAQLKLGRQAAARATLNQLLTMRKASTYTKDITLDDVLLERQKEFVGEGHRFFDLKRNQKSVDRVGFNSHNKIKTIQASDFKWVFPLPSAEIDQNKNARQNPRW